MKTFTFNILIHRNDTFCQYDLSVSIRFVHTVYVYFHFLFVIFGLGHVASVQSNSVTHCNHIERAFRIWDHAFLKINIFRAFWVCIVIILILRIKITF